MDVSPFPHQGPVDPDRVPTRRDLVADLVERVSERRVTALLGPRRFGKTSALRAVAAELSDTSTTIWLDLFELSSWADLATRLDRAIAAAPVVRPTVNELAARVQLRLGVLDIEFRRPASERPDAEATASALVELVVQYARLHPTTLIIDEFSGIVGTPGAAGLLRTALQHDYERIGLLFAGSEPSTMEMLFADRAQPFYAQADIVRAPRLSLSELTEAVEHGFAATGRDAGSLAAEIHAFTEGHPHRSMQLADAAWRSVVPGAGVGPTTFGLALVAVVAAADSGLERLFASLPTGEQRALRTMAAGESLFGAYGSSLGLSTGGAQHARRQLNEQGHIEQVERTWHIVDPVFEEWIRQRFG